jgi:hypothetical protein
MNNKDLDLFKINSWFWRYKFLKDFCAKLGIFKVEKNKQDWYVFSYLKAII